MLTLSQALLRLSEPLLPRARHVPFAVQQQLLQYLTARLFAAPLANGSFDLLCGRWLRLQISDLDLSWCLTRSGSGLKVMREAPTDVTIRGNWREFLLLASRLEDPDTLFFRRRLVIEGDTELGLALKNLIDSLDPDDLPPRLWQLLGGLGAQVKAEQAGVF